MVHYFNNTYRGQTPEIFIANLHKYLIVKGIVKNLSEFYNVIKDVTIEDSGFELRINEDFHVFKPYDGFVMFEENCPQNCLIISEAQNEWVSMPEKEKKGNSHLLL